MDPTKVRLSDNFLLSDFMGCDSVYRHGYRNIILKSDSKKIREGQFLAEHLLEDIVWLHGPLSIGYGYISPDLSRHIVKYQDPDKPSYHRWDLGAACDIVVHDWVQKGAVGQEGDAHTSAPIYLAHNIDEEVGDYSRMITYSESPYLCVATRSYEPPRRAFYENRYEGRRGAKPRFITKPRSSQARIAEGNSLELAHDWRGQGYPSYHCGRRKGYENHRMGRYVMLSDLLYSPLYVRDGIQNRPPTSMEDPFWRLAATAADVIDSIVEYTGQRVSIVRGCELQGPRDWNSKTGFILDIVPAISGEVSANEIEDLLHEHPQVREVAVLDLGKRLQIAGGTRR